MILVWLDDLRNPFYGEWVSCYSPIGIDNVETVWLKSYDEFTRYIESNGLPDGICFDHDLGGIDLDNEKTGYDCAKYLVEYCIDRGIDIPKFNIQSSNPAGKENIMKLLENYHKHFINERF